MRIAPRMMGLALGLMTQWEGMSICRTPLEAVLLEGANQPGRPPRGLGLYPVPPWDAGVVKCPNHGVLPPQLTG